MYWRVAVGCSGIGAAVGGRGVKVLVGVRVSVAVLVAVAVGFGGRFYLQRLEAVARRLQNPIADEIAPQFGVDRLAIVHRSRRGARLASRRSRWSPSRRTATLPSRPPATPSTRPRRAHRSGRPSDLPTGTSGSATRHEPDRRTSHEPGEFGRFGNLPKPQDPAVEALGSVLAARRHGRPGHGRYPRSRSQQSRCGAFGAIRSRFFMPCVHVAVVGRLARSWRRSSGRQPKPARARGGPCERPRGAWERSLARRIRAERPLHGQEGRLSRRPGPPPRARRLLRQDPQRCRTPRPRKRWQPWGPA